MVGTAENGQLGLELIARARPDVVTLDIQMPVLDGLSTLRKMGERPAHRWPPVLVCSSLTADGSHEALEAMRLGAADFITKDAVRAAGNDPGFKGELIEKIRAVAQAARRRSARAVAPRDPAGPRGPVGAQGVGGASGASEAVGPLVKLAAPSRPAGVLAIGSSTGGPPVVERLVGALPGAFGFPVVVAQHMPALFTKSLAERLDRAVTARVVLGEHGQRVEPGVVYIAEGGRHTRLARKPGGVVQLEVSEEPRALLYKPSVDELFRSASEVFGGGAVGVVLTGMGHDGAIGAGAMKAAGGSVYAQDEASCVVYGMPRAVIEAGTATGGGIESLEALVASLAGGGSARKAG